VRTCSDRVASGVEGCRKLQREQLWRGVWEAAKELSLLGALLWLLFSIGCCYECEFA
jgi:hypothetical protein